MIIKSSTRNYEAIFVPTLDFLKDFKNASNTFFVVDKNLFPLYPSMFVDIPHNRLFSLDATEEAKTMETVLKICERMSSMDAKRNSVLVSIGGGITQDITGFAANILYRGIRWIFIPTTLLSSSDSCIGSKTSLNFNKYKNSIGTFYPPDKIYIYTKFCNTLSIKDYLSGIGEIIKFNAMQGSERLARLEETLPKLLSKDPHTLSEYIESSLKFKKTFIETDEFDRGERIKLNFAHTIGHALEVTSNYHIPHGTAVAIGMTGINFISVQRNVLSNEIAKRIENIVLKIIDIPLKNTYFDIDALCKAIRHDKKQINSDITAIILNNDFKLNIINNLSKDEIQNMTLHLKNLYARFING